MRRLSTEKEEEEESTGSGSGSTNAKDDEKGEHWHGFEEKHEHHPRAGLVRLHHQTESEAVREWEARIARDRAEAKRKKEAEKLRVEEQQQESEKVEDEIKPH